MVEDLFEKELQERKIFKNVSILSPHYVPVELPHRENEIRDLTRIIAHVLRNEKPDNIFVYGKTGTGKTVSVKYVLRKLEEFVQNPEKNSNNVIVGVVYMNCKVRNSKYQVFLKILEDEALNTEGLKSIPLSDRSDKGLKGMDPADLYERLLKVIQDNGLNIVVVLDEIDMITNGLNDVVYLLTRINDEIKSGSLSIIGISNDARFKKRLDPRTKSTLCE
ncbi:MAG: AAA family ATPase, partial [Candidatus Altiarchaeales archaeon]|nr:AAA family ATPase [Candidatus Altiarchaeota archaeon]MCG2782190.1 AAA family ATPase [Candidatus Altiarchaeales archaeon]